MCSDKDRNVSAGQGGKAAGPEELRQHWEVGAFSVGEAPRDEAPEGVG